MSKESGRAPPRGEPGPEPERLHIPGRDWRDAIKKALRKKRPPSGWPKPSIRRNSHYVSPAS
jgi:hypothetical protein